jgi:hypothetical protein
MMMMNKRYAVGKASHRAIFSVAHFCAINSAAARNDDVRFFSFFLHASQKAPNILIASVRTKYKSR